MGQIRYTFVLDQADDDSAGMLHLLRSSLMHLTAGQDVSVVEEPSAKPVKVQSRKRSKK